MATRRLGLICLLCVLVSLAGGCTRTRPGERIVAKDVTKAIWSKDSKGIYYHNGRSDICRYDVIAGRRDIYHVQVEELYGFDVSPDGHRIAFRQDGEGIYTADLETGRVSLVYRTKERTVYTCWLSADCIAFKASLVEERGSKLRLLEDKLYLLDLSSGSVAAFKGSGVAIRASEGGGFVYIDSRQRYRFHDLDDGTDKALPPCPPFNGHDHVRFLFLDEQRLIYSVWRSSDYLYTEIADLKNMRTRRIVLPDAHPYMMLSPDLMRYWYVGGDMHSSWGSLRLIAANIPPQTVKQLKAPVK